MYNAISNDRGMARIITLAIMALLSGVVLMSVDRSSTDIELSYNQLHEEQAFYIAEAGAKRAVVELQGDVNWRAGFNNVELGDGLDTVSITDSLLDSALIETVIVLSVGTVKGSNSSIEIDVIPLPIYPFGFAMFSESGITMDKNTCTDSYNSDSGTYAATVLDSLGSVGTNGTLTTSKDVAIGGGVTVATPGGITTGPFTTINGDSTSTADSVDLAIIPDTEYDWAKTVSGAPLGLSGSGYAYDPGTQSLTLASGANVELQSGVYYFSSILAGSFSDITIAPGAEVTIYLTGDMVMNQGSTVNDGGAPTDFFVYSKGTTLQFDQDNIFNGAFYGPNATVQFDQTTTVYGSLVGGTIQMDAGACFHYDRSLSQITKGFSEVMEAIAWGEVY